MEMSGEEQYDEQVTQSKKSSSKWIWIIIGAVIGVIIIGTITVGVIYLIQNPDTQTILGCYNGDGPTNGQTATFRATNHCCEPIWMEARAGPCSSPLPGQSQTVFKVNPGSSVDFDIPTTGLAATRFWAKWGCDDNGTNCFMGDQDPTWVNTGACPEPYGCGYDTCPLPGSCPVGGCTPPIDSLFEATFGCTASDPSDCNYNTSSCTGGCNYKGCQNGGCTPLDNITSFDASQVDGWTLPYRLYVKGSTEDLAACNNGAGAVNVNALGLSLGKCPTTEDLTDNGQYLSVTDNNLNPPVTYSTTSVDLRLINQNQIAACFSPCQKLSDGQPSGFGQSVGTPPTNMYCCPTPDPNDCNLPSCVTPSECSNGPVATTQYVTAVHTMAPGIYAYAYDDGVGLQNCPAGSVIYEFELCGQGAPAYPYPL